MEKQIKSCTDIQLQLVKKFAVVNYEGEGDRVVNCQFLKPSVLDTAIK